MKWDANNTVYVTVNGEHNGKHIRGMCGNNDGNPAVTSESHLVTHNCISAIQLIHFYYI